MRILVTGAAGQLGRAMRTVLSGPHEVTWTDQEDLDVRDAAAVRARVRAERPAAIVHLAALTQVDACESAPEPVLQVNTLGTRYVALAAEEVGARLLFTSTDYVFDGTLGRAYSEYDSPHPLNVYGWSKLHGERIVQSLVRRHFVVRTSGLFGVGGANFPEAILRAAATGAVQVVADQVCRPTYVADLAAALGIILASENYGIFHVASCGETSWFEFARAIVAAAGGDPALVKPITTEQLARPARRPAQSVLDTTAYETTFERALPHWRVGLQTFLHLRGGGEAG